MQEPPQYLTTAQVAEVKGVSVRTVARWVKSGRLPYALKVPGDTGAYLFDPNAVDHLADEPTEASA